MKIKILFFLVIALQSCSPNGYKKEYDFRLPDTSTIPDKSPIILTMVNASYFKYDEKDKFDHEFVRMDWCKLGENKICEEVVNFNPFTKNKFNDMRNSYVVKPGFYYLDEMNQSGGLAKKIALMPVAFVLGSILGPSAGSLLDNKVDFYTSKSGWNKKLSVPNFASFKAEAGEIVYIGDLYFTFTTQKYWVDGKVNLEVKDNYDDAVKFFHYKHPEYKDKPVIKRLAKPGILLDNYDAGFFW